MKKTIRVIAALLLLTAAGCESTPNDNPSSAQQNSYQPTDGRNLGPGMQEASHGDPQFPADVDRGGGGGMR